MNKIDSRLISDITKLVNNFAYAHNINDREELLSYFLEKTSVVINKYEPSKGDFQFYLRKCLKFYGFNYLRDKNRSVKLPRSYSEIFQKYQSELKKNPLTTKEEFCNKNGIAIAKLEEAIQAASTRFVELKDYHQCNKPTSYKSLCAEYLRNLPNDEVSMLEEIFLENKKPCTVFQKYGLDNESGLQVMNTHLAELELLRT